LAMVCASASRIFFWLTSSSHGEVQVKG
jgi:hypothetical protein